MEREGKGLCCNLHSLSNSTKPTVGATLAAHHASSRVGIETLQSLGGFAELQQSAFRMAWEDVWAIGAKMTYSWSTQQALCVKSPTGMTFPNR